MELAQGLTQLYAETFIARVDLHAVQLADGSYVSVKKPLTLEHVAAHLQGSLTLGAYALDTDIWARWLCLDADDWAQWRGLWRMAHRLEGQGVTAYLEPSRRGGHLWLFLSPLAGVDARRLGTQLLAEHDLLDVELFPKQDQLTTGPGSLVRLPLGIHRKAGRRYHFVTLQGEPLAATLRDQAWLLGNPARVPQTFIDRALARAPASSERHPPPAFAPPPDDDFPYEPADEPLSARLKRRISVYDFVSQYVALDSRGRGRCPFHDDRHPSFQVNREQNYWSCYAGCGGGSIIDFMIKWRDLHGQDADFVATITELAGMLL